VQRELVATMVALNRDASRAAVALAARCATDITGFGLLGHASHVARASGATLRVVADRVPLLVGAREAWLRGHRTGGAERNADYLAPLVEWRNASVDEPLRALLVDPQTSGGLLVALAPAAAERYLGQVPGSVDVGEVLLPGGKAIVVD
jgi:selenide, water dikinase